MRGVVHENWKFVGALALTAALFVPVLVFGSAAMAQSGGASSSQYAYPSPKVTLCHHTGSKKHPWVKITVAASAVPAHERHGDVTPPCPATNAHKHVTKHVKHSAKTKRHGKH